MRIIKQISSKPIIIPVMILWGVYIGSAVIAESMGMYSISFPLASIGGRTIASATDPVLLIIALVVGFAAKNNRTFIIAVFLAALASSLYIDLIAKEFRQGFSLINLAARFFAIATLASLVNTLTRKR